MDPNDFKPDHVRAYTVPCSEEQQLAKKISRFVAIEVPEEDFFSE
jgi:hypothetical protein